MRTPRNINSLILVNTCVEISINKWNNYMEGTTKASGSIIKKHIKRYLPELYESLALNFYNPYEHLSVKKEGLFVYVHSGVEYFIKFN